MEDRSAPRQGSVCLGPSRRIDTTVILTEHTRPNGAPTRTSVGPRHSFPSQAMVIRATRGAEGRAVGQLRRRGGMSKVVKELSRVVMALRLAELGIFGAEKGSQDAEES